MQYYGARGADTHITEPAQRYVYPLSIFWLFELSLAGRRKFCQSYLFNATRERHIIIITLDKARNENECLHQHCGPRRTWSRKTRQKQLCNYFVSNPCSFVDYVAHYGESFVVPLTMILKIHKNKRNKTDTCLEGWGVGDTHFHWQPYSRDPHITRDMCTGIHISQGYACHCDTGVVYHLPQIPGNSGWDLNLKSQIFILEHGKKLIGDFSYI